LNWRPSEAGGWLWLFVFLACVGLVAHTTLGLVLAMVGWYSTWIVLPVTAIALLASWPWLVRAVPQQEWQGRLPPLVMTVMATVILGYSAANMGQHVFVQRDPGSYLTTGRWLADHGGLRADVADPLLDAVPGISYAGPAVYETEPGIVEFQFSHGPSVTMATAYDLGGPRGLFASAAVVASLALLAVFLALTTVTRSPWLAVAGATAVGISLPMIYASRATYSEPFVLLLLTTALALLLARGRDPRRGQLVLVGLLVGASTMFRIDAQLYIVGLLAVAVVLLLRGTRLTDVAAMVGAAVAPVLVGIVDVRGFAGTYAAGLAGNVALLDAAAIAFAVSAFAAGAWIHRRGRPFLIDEGNDRVGVWAAAAVALVGLAAWLVRPTLWPASPAWSTDSAFADAVVRLQEQSGLPPDPNRSYSELSIESLSWYVGPVVVVLAIVGFALVTWRVVAVPTSRFLPAATLALVGVPVYLYDTNITPDQLWATRRFVPFVLPVFVVAAVWAADRIIVSSRERARSAVTLVLAASFVFPALAATWPVREHSEQRGALGAIDRLCAELDHRSVVLDLDGGAFSMPVRAWCGAAVGTVSTDQSGADAFVELAAESCAEAFVLTATTDAVERFGTAIELAGSHSVVNPRLTEATLTEPPTRYVDQPMTWALGRVVVPDSCPE
jgi:hypothetical protein